MGEGLGVRALFQWKFMAPMRVHVMCRWKLSMNLTFGNSKLLAFSPLTPALSPLRGEGAGFMAPMRVHLMCRWKLPMKRTEVPFNIQP
jgi:hypothetical protein